VGLERRLGEGGVGGEEVATETIEADVCQIDVAVAGRRVGITLRGRNEGTGEIESVAAGVEDDLDDVGVADDLRVVGGLGKGGDVGVGVALEEGDGQLDGFGLYLGFVALDVDDDVGLDAASGLGHAIGSAAVVGRRHDGLSAE